MTSNPYVGDIIEHPALGDDVRIEVSEIPQEQPVLETDGLHVIIDQYGETHLVELDGETWIATGTHVLSDEGFDRWTSFQSAVSATP